MRRLPVLKPKEVLKVLERVGFYIHHQKGSHITLKHFSDPNKRVTIPYHRRDLQKATLRSIIRQAGLNLEKFLELFGK